MALDLQDLPTIKVDQQVHAMLKAESLVHRIELNALVRDVLHEWAKKKFDAFSMAREICKSKGLTELDGEWK